MIAIRHIAEPPSVALRRSPDVPMSMLDVLPGSATGRIKTRHNAAYS